MRDAAIARLQQVVICNKTTIYDVCSQTGYELNELLVYYDKFYKDVVNYVVDLEGRIKQLDEHIKKLTTFL